MGSKRDLTILSIEVKCLIKLLGRNDLHVCWKCKERLAYSIFSSCYYCHIGALKLDYIMRSIRIPEPGDQLNHDYELYLATLSNEELLDVLPTLPRPGKNNWKK